MSGRSLVMRHYIEVRHEIKNSDLLLWRGRTLGAYLIRVIGRSEYSHSDKAAWWGKDLFCMGMLTSGGRAVTLSSQIVRNPGQIDLYETNPDNRHPDYNRDRATRFMKRLCGWQYGWGKLFSTAFLHIPIIRGFIHINKKEPLAVPLHTDDLERPKYPPFCSMACAMADRVGGGIDRVSDWADQFTEPDDLAKSDFYRYRYTLIP
jgi:hypothetical protein